MGLDGLFESSGVQEAAGDVVVKAAESEGCSSDGFDPAVDGFGGVVRPVRPIEVGQDVAHAFSGCVRARSVPDIRAQIRGRRRTR